MTIVSCSPTIMNVNIKKINIFLASENVFHYEQRPTHSKSIYAPIELEQRLPFSGQRDGWFYVYLQLQHIFYWLTQQGRTMEIYTWM